MQRGLRCGLQVCWLKSSTRSAVVFLSIVTGFKAGGGGACTDAHSSMIVSARADCTMMQLANPTTAALNCHKKSCGVDIAFPPGGETSIGLPNLATPVCEVNPSVLVFQGVLDPPRALA